MAERLCTLKKKGGGSSGPITTAILEVNSPVSISAGHIAVASAWQLSQMGSPSASITVSGIVNTDYEVLLEDSTTDYQSGEFKVRACRALVIRAINNVTITLSHSGGTNFKNGGAMVYDLS